MLDRVKVYVEGVEIPSNVIGNVEITYSFNNFAMARIGLAADVESPGIFKDKTAYENLTALLLKGYPDVKVLVDGRVLFEGIALQVMSGRSYANSSVYLVCFSTLILADLYKFFILNVNNLNDYGVVLSQMSLYPVKQSFGSETQVMIEKLSKVIEKVVKKEKSIKEFAKSILEPPTEMGEEYAVVEWYKKYYDVVPLHNLVETYSKNFSHLVKFFGTSLLSAETLKAVLFGLLQREQIAIDSPWRMFLKVMNAFQLYFVEVPTAKGLSVVFKPMYLFHPPPRSNLIPSHHLLAFNISEETGTGKPTRLFLMPYSAEQFLVESGGPILSASAIAAKTVAAPEELERQALARLLGRDAGDSTAEELAKEVFADLGSLEGQYKEYNKILLEEEESRGVIPAFQTLPPGIADAVEKLPPYLGWLVKKELALNYFHMMRAQASQAQIVMHFNPFLLAGHPLAFSDGHHFYNGFVLSCTHSLSPGQFQTSVVLSNFSRLRKDEGLDQYSNFVSIFEMLDKGENAESFGEADFEDYYNSLFGVSLGTPADLEQLELKKYSGLPELLNETHNVWHRPISTEGRPFKVDPQIQEMVKRFVSELLSSNFQ